MALFQYWNRLRGRRPAPLRTEIEPAEIKQLLADTFILERGDHGETAFRLAGTRMCAIYGKELKGHLFPSLWARKDTQAINRLVDHVSKDNAVCVIAYEGATRDSRINNFEMILLPLAGKGERPRFLGTVQPLMKPFWLGADPIVENKIGSFHFVNPEEMVAAPLRSTINSPSLSPDGELMAAETEQGRRIRHLVVYQGGRAG